MKRVNYNIKLNVNNLKNIFRYFDMNEKNTIIKLDTKNESIRKEIKEYILKDEKDYLILHDIKFEKLYYYLSRNIVFNIYYYKNMKDDNYEVCIHTRMDKIHDISFNDKYDLDKTKEFFKKYRSINIEYIILFLIILIGILIRIFN